MYLSSNYKLFKTPLSPARVDLKISNLIKICHFANHPYLCKGLLEE
ncbi:MAG: hypothetical protein H0A76_09950 [Candidatus Thiodubiliella endoseptemdiera]|uniref:Uncharacterized protein n=1 Tax=Candidatus Thiodubiliella endoseptemdiera TaxID=2738886 RepID=A0A853F6L6_9GAMM|nr:hypothetical protein [Candidatus Thiodubiliella endoseptemdiera]